MAKKPLRRKDYLVWLDCEMSGLDPERHVLLEIGCAVTDNDLNLIAMSPAWVIFQPQRVLDRMDPWCIKQHGRSGLTARVQQSKDSLRQVERETLQFLKRYCFPNSSPLCGNSIGQDRRFLHRYMPQLNDFFHYRNIDVSSIKELVQRWYPDQFHPPEKSKTHHVLDDVRESIEELRYYRKMVFR